MRTRRLGMVLGLAILAMGAIGCDDDDDPLAPPEDVDITGSWSFTAQTTNPVMVTSCTTDDLQAQFGGSAVCSFGLMINQVNASFLATSTSTGTCDIVVTDGMLMQSTVAGTASPIQGQVTWANPPKGTAASANVTFEGGATNQQVIITPTSLWDAAGGDSPITVCAGQQDVECEDDPRTEPDEGAATCEELNVCTVFLAQEGVGGGIPPLKGSCSGRDDEDVCVLVCEADTQLGCFEESGASRDCPDNGACIDLLDACESLGPCIEATCSFTGSFVATQAVP